MNAKDFIEAIKNLFYDFLGYFLPGFTLLLLFSITVSPKYFITTPILKFDPSLYLFITFIISYILGYLVSGIGIIKDDLNPLSSSARLENKIKDRNDFKMALAKYNIYIKTNSLGGSLTPNIKTRELRTLCFGFLTTDEKNLIYTFMFRSDLCKHLYNTFLLLGISGLTNYVVKYNLNENFDLLQTGKNSLTIYILFILISFIFRSIRNNFYDKSIKLPFSMYLSK